MEPPGFPWEQRPAFEASAPRLVAGQGDSRVSSLGAAGLEPWGRPCSKWLGNMSGSWLLTWMITWLVG